MKITNILDEQFTNFASYVIVNNLPSIDGLLPVQRKVLWALHKNGVSSNKPFIKLHRAGAMAMVYYIMGDIPLFSAMKNMANNGLNYMYLSPKGSFGDKRKKFDDGASPRYVEARLSVYSEDCLLRSINKNVVPMKRNFDNSEDEPIILPSIIPNILINTSQSIAVGMASKIPAHNVIDTCDSVINYIKTNNIETSINILKCPDFEGTKGKIIYDKNTFDKIYKTGKGSFSIVGNYIYNEKTNTFSIIEVPYEAYIEDIEAKLESAYEKGLFKEVVDVHNSSGVQGIQLDITLKKNTNIKTFEQKLRKYTPFESKFSCNFTILDLDGKTPKLMSLEDIYNTWIQHRINCIKNEIQFDLDKNTKELNKLYGLQIINQDLDKAIKIIRSSNTEKIAIDNLIDYFKLNQEQAEYIATIRLVNINQEWIVNKIKNIQDLEQENVRLNEYYNSENLIKETIISQLEEIKKKYGKPRATEIIYPEEAVDITKEDLIEDYTVTLCLTKENYLKKNLKYSESQKVKDGDEVIQLHQTTNKTDLLFITNKGRLFIRKTYDIEEKQPSQIGDYLPNILDDLQEDEKVIYIHATKDWSENLICVFENGNVSKMNLLKSKPRQNRKVAIEKIYNTDSPLISITVTKDDIDILLATQSGHGLIINTKDINAVSSKNGKGVVGIKLDTENMTDDKIIGALMNISINNSCTLETAKGKELCVVLNDVSPNPNKSLYDYLYGKRGRLGNFIFNTRQKNDKVTKIKLNK